MKQLIFFTGGRGLANDDFEVLQSEAYAAITAILQGAPPMVLSGCTLSNKSPDGLRADIQPGFVWLGGEIHRYDGASDVPLPLEIALGAIEESDVRAYQTGGSKPCMSEQLLLTQAKGTAAAGAAITYGTVIGPELTYWKWVENNTRTIGEVQWLTNHTASQYDGTGRGWLGQPAAGWALCNGQNGTADLRERFIAGMNPANSDYSPGNTGGSAQVTLTTNQLPAHAHGMESAGAHTHGIGTRGSDGSDNTISRGNAPTSDRTLQTQSAGAHTHTINETGGNQPHENRPPFYVLVARQWVGV
ncbi:hypothetical protein [Hymenobacter sp. YC55]|uniref:hypothetical protein n=1 Tax=Hymenobacter sp. YC55 TaxID=3034019 RepID=UPI0023F86350|nr:hypothetical protein [Hymenobacter sp. YC55]MDF7809898.1 hypothetical protein [Hymenobacter sp. YC55]